MYLALAFVAIGTLIFVGVFFTAYALLRSSWTVDRLRRKEPVSPNAWWKASAERVEGFLKSVGETIPRPPEELSRQGLLLVRAGIRRKDGPLIFVGVQAGVALLLFVGLRLMDIHPVLSLVFALFGGAAIPDIALKMMIRKRQERIQHGLPDALDLMVVCVEAGLGLDHSMKRIGEELRVSYPDLSDELNLFHLEIRAGRSRLDAMRNLAKRTDLDDLRALVAILIQTDRFGTSIGQSLRVFAEGMRVKRRQRAEEHAAKIAVKMIPPMVVFVFPSIFVVVAGPAVISIVRGLLPFLAGSTN